MSNRMGFLERAQVAYNILRYGAPVRRSGGVKAAPFRWPVWVDGKLQWQMLDFETYAREGYNQNALIFSAIMYKVRALTSAKLGAFTGDPKHPEPAAPTHRLSTLLARPNFHQSTTEFLQQGIVYQNIAGNWYIFLDRNNKSKQYPIALYNLRPDRVKIVPGERTLKGFMYYPEGKNEGVPILPEDMIHIKYPNPLDPLEGLGYGLSPIAPSAQSGDADNAVTRMLKLLFDNGTMLGGVLKFNLSMDDEDVADARRRWQEVYGGVHNWGQVAILDNAGDFTPLSVDLQKLTFKDIDGRNEARVLGPLGVPGMLIGMPGAMERSTYANFEQADRVFWTNTFIPELRLSEIELQFTLTDGEVYPRYDTSEVPALQKNIPFCHGAVNGFEGRVMTVIPGSSACLTCLYHGVEIPKAKFPVIGVTPAVIGCIQATEVIKYLTGLGELLAGRLLNYDGLSLKFTEFKVKRDPDCPDCGKPTAGKKK